MQNLAKGANAPLPPGPATVTVAASAAVDVSALLLTADGVVRGDDDFVFYNQPTAPGVRHRPDGVDVDPAAVEPAIERVVVTASLDGSGPATFGALGDLRMDIAVGGQPTASFVPDGLGPETALLCVEIYRRAGAWKVRAVGQGYANGLAGIATDFGITVEEPAPAPAEVDPAPAKVNLDKGRVSLRKRETVSLVKTGAPALRRIAMGLGWDPATGGKNIDLDASVIVVDEGGRKVDAVWFMAKSAYKGAIEHSGDNLTGQGDGDDETIIVDLGRLPAQAHALVFTVTSFRRHTFTAVKNAYCRLLDLDSGAELVRFDLTDSKDQTAVIMAMLVRAGAVWEMTAIGDFHDGTTARAMYKPAEALVQGR